MSGSLRTELIGGGDLPEFAILLPHGWRYMAGDAEHLFETLLAAVKEVPHQARQGLEPSIRSMIEQARSAPGSRRLDMAGVIRQVDVPEDQHVPMSITLSWFRPPTGATVQSFGRHLIETRSAAPMPDSPGLLRWTEVSDLESDGDRGKFGGPSYLVPAAGNQRLALMIRTVLPIPSSPSEEEQRMQQAMVLLSDSIVSTLRWKRDAV